MLLAVLGLCLSQRAAEAALALAAMYHVWRAARMCLSWVVLVLMAVSSPLVQAMACRREVQRCCAVARVLRAARAVE
jgi:hypothetical protein